MNNAAQSDIMTARSASMYKYENEDAVVFHGDEKLVEEYVLSKPELMLRLYALMLGDQNDSERPEGNDPGDQESRELADC